MCRCQERMLGPSMLKVAIQPNIAVFRKGRGSIIYTLTLKKRLLKHEMTNQLDLRLIEKSYCQLNTHSRWSTASQVFMNMNS